MRIEDGGKEQYHQQEIDDIGKGVVEPVVEHDDNESQRNARPNPDNLHTRTCVEAEDVRLAIRITGSADTDPSEGQQGDINSYRPPVDAAQYTLLLLTCLLYHTIYVCVGIHWLASVRLPTVFREYTVP